MAIAARLAIAASPGATACQSSIAASASKQTEPIPKTAAMAA
jgi:hypothetical protein